MEDDHSLFIQVRVVQNYRRCEMLWKDKDKFAFRDENGSTHTFNWTELIKIEDDKGGYRNDR